MRPEGDIKPCLELCEVLFRHDVQVNDIADQENQRTPLLMILTNKDVISKGHAQEKLGKVIEFFVSKGAVFDAPEKDKEKIRENLSRFSNKQAIQILMTSAQEMQSNHGVSGGNVLVGHESTLPRRSKISFESEEQHSKMLGPCCGLFTKN